MFHRLTSLYRTIKILEYVDSWPSPPVLMPPHLVTRPHSLSATTAMDAFQVQNERGSEGVLTKQWGLATDGNRRRMDDGNGIRHVLVLSRF